MSKGTKQIRSGRVESCIKVLEQKLNVYVTLLKSNEVIEGTADSDERIALRVNNVAINSRIDEINSTIHMLRGIIE